LIAFEGIDGAGKTTQVELLAAALRDAGHRVLMTREPTGGPHGEEIRSLSSRGIEISAEEELDYFIADRRQHVGEVIAPALARGEVVITDRYFLSNVAYQGARGLSPREILHRNQSEFPDPDVVLLLETSPSRGLDRVRKRAEDLNRSFEEEAFLTRVVAIFDSLEIPYLRRISADASPGIVHASVREALTEFFDFG
jgi:dTMP kinase